MTTVTLSSKGQLTIPRQLRQALGLVAGALPVLRFDRAFSAQEGIELLEGA